MPPEGPRCPHRNHIKTRSLPAESSLGAHSKKPMKSPAFQFYAADFLVGVMGLSDEEIGIYIKMLAVQWERGSLPNDRKMIKKLINSRKVPSEFVLSKFEICSDNLLRNARLEKEREKQASFRESRAKNAKKRWTKEEPEDALASSVHAPSTYETDALQSSSSSLSSELREREERAPARSTRSRIQELPANDFSETMPTEVAKKFDRIQQLINGCHPQWEKRSVMTYQELQDMKANAEVLFSFSTDDWRLLSMFMGVKIDPDWNLKAWQPDSRGLFIRNIADVMNHADKWARECKKRKVPTGLEMIG